MNNDWETELARLLGDLSTAQEELLDLLAEKRQLLADSDAEGLVALGPREEQLIDKLEACHDQRRRLLGLAESDGLPSENLQSLAAALPDVTASRLQQPMQAAQAQSRLLHHQSLTNWVLVQRTLIHLSQLLEIFATGGEPEPTYTKDRRPHNSGSLVDQAV